MEQNKHGELSHVYLWSGVVPLMYFEVTGVKILDKHICKKILKSLNYIVTLNKMSMTYLFRLNPRVRFQFCNFCGKDYDTTVATDELLCLKNADAQILMFFTTNE